MLKERKSPGPSQGAPCESPLRELHEYFQKFFLLLEKDSPDKGSAAKPRFKPEGLSYFEWILMHYAGIWPVEKSTQRHYAPFSHTRKFIREKSAPFGDFWTNREKFVSLMRKMGYTRLSKHMVFIRRKKIWDELPVTPWRPCLVPRSYFKAIGADEEQLRHALRLDQEEYLEVLSEEKNPRFLFVTYTRWHHYIFYLPEGLKEEEAVDYVAKALKEVPSHLECHLKDRHFAAAVVFPGDVKRIIIEKDGKTEVLYRYPEIQERKAWLVFRLNSRLPED